MLQTLISGILALGEETIIKLIAKFHHRVPILQILDIIQPLVSDLTMMMAAIMIMNMSMDMCMIFCVCGCGHVMNLW